MDLSTTRNEGPSLSSILALEALVGSVPQVETPVRHHFAEGLYVREMLIPAGTVIVGKVHRQSHLNIMTRGRMIVWTQEGRRELVVSTEPFVIESKAGTKKVGYALEDTVWLNIHLNPANERDMERLEGLYILSERQGSLFPPEELDALMEQKLLEV